MKIIRLLWIVLFAFVCQPSNAQSLAYKTLLKGIYDNEFPVVKIDEQNILETAVFLYTRERVEYEVSHLQDAQWVGFNDFDLETVKGMDKNGPIVVYCSIGARSQDIGKKLMEAGFTRVYNLYGGIFHWVNEELPVYNNGKPTQKIHAYNKVWGIWLSKGEKVY